MITGWYAERSTPFSCRETLNVNIDLHIHSTASDGSMTPTQVVQ